MSLLLQFFITNVKDKFGKLKLILEVVILQCISNFGMEELLCVCIYN